MMRDGDGLGQVAEAIQLGTWIAGMFRFGGKPVTRLGKVLAQLAQSRGTEPRAAEGWAREYEKTRDSSLSRHSIVRPAVGQPAPFETAFAVLLEGMLDQLSPAVTRGEWEQVRAAAGGTQAPLPPGYVYPGIGGGTPRQAPRVTPGQESPEERGESRTSLSAGIAASPRAPRSF